MFNATNQLTNITNNNLISSSKQWRKPDSQFARTAARELELQQKLKHSSTSSNSMNTNQSGLKDKENGNINDTKKVSAMTYFTEAELAAKRKEFIKCRFYLDNLEGNVQASIERGIKLLGATQEKFFSNKCTHLITTKHIPIQDNLLQSSSCDTNATKQTNNARKNNEFVPKDTIVENALSWGIVLWSSDVMMKTVDNLMRSRFSNKNNKKLLEKKGLGKVLQDEKLFGPSTGANNDAQSRRPHFVPFTGHYLVIEDATHVHRPVILRQYTKQVYSKRPAEYPWPYLKHTEGCKSPFVKANPPTQPKKENQPDTNTTAAQPKTKAAAAVDDTNNDKENSMKQLIRTPPRTPNTSTAAAAHIHPCTPNTTTISHDIATPPPTPPVATVNNTQPDSQHSLRASGFQPSLTNNPQSVSTRSVSTSVSTMQSNNHRRVPTGEINRLDKRMVENVTQNEHQKLHKQAMKEKIQRENERARRERGKKKDLRYCENCNCQFEKLEDHINDPTHQTFIRDQNNFNYLDELLEKTRRVYKNPLPERWRNLVDTNIDGKRVQFAPADTNSTSSSSSSSSNSNGKRSRTVSSNASTSSPSSTSSNKLSTPLMMSKQAEPPRIVDPQSTKDKNQGWGKYHDVFL